jgi:thiol-disulfide isomerase/thioredoxin
MSGRTISLDDLEGRVVLVDFWASWCGPCMTEMPNVVALHDKFHDQGLEVIGVSLDRAGAEAAIAGVEKRFGMKWEQVYDGGHWQAALAVKNGVRGIPAVFLVDRAGKVRHTPSDRLRGASLEKAVAALIAEKTPD